MSFRQDANSQPGDMIFHGSRNERVMVDHERRNVTVIDETQIQALMAQINNAMAQYQQMLANVPPGQREKHRAF